MARAKTTDQFRIEAMEVHGNKYDYSETEYTGSHLNLKIICPNHGVFEQIASVHLRGSGCPKCSFISINEKNTITTEEFKERAGAAHNYFYNYDKVDYKGSHIHVIITCPIHGDFSQAASNHLNGKRGCKLCAHEGRKSTTEEFIEVSSKVHNNEYDYSLVEYTFAREKVIIICNEHGEFKQTPHAHITGVGCPACAIANTRLTLDEFKKKAKDIHGNNYDYSESIYVNCETKLKIKCNSCSRIFEQKAGNHLKGKGCPNCCRQISKPCKKWLNLLGIPDDKEHREVKIKIGDMKFKADGFDPTTNTVYEFNGDYWHGNPIKYDQSKESGLGGKTFGDLYNNTINREIALKEAGYKVISIWESDWNKQQKELKQ